MLGTPNALLDKSPLGRVRKVEISCANIEGVDINGALPVIAMQVHVFLRVHESADETTRVVAEGLDGFALDRFVIAEEADLFSAVEAQTQRLSVVDVGTTIRPLKLKTGVLLVVVGCASGGRGIFDKIDVMLAVEELNRVV